MESTEKLADTYTEPFSNYYFRKDHHGFWYDIEGHRLAAPVFIQGSILISLPAKKSKQSLSFQGKEILASPNYELIQIGKIVFNQNLELVDFYGEKITGLGVNYISFENGNAVQEVSIGLDEKAFLDIQSQRPFLINNEIVTKHLQTIRKGKKRFEIFETKGRKYALSAETGKPILCDGELLEIDFSTYLKINGTPVVKCTDEEGSRYVDIEKQSNFLLPILGEQIITQIDIEPHQVNGDLLRNITSSINPSHHLKSEYIYNETKNEIFKLNNGQVTPQKIQKLNGYEKHFAIVWIDDSPTLFSKKTLKIFETGSDKIRLSNIISPADQPLLNAITSNGEKIVLDARRGLDQLEIAKIGGTFILEVFQNSQKVGNSFLQNASIKTIGGSERRVIDLSKNELAIYQLPNDLKVYPENNEHSVFCNGPIHELDFNNIITIGREQFIEGKFIPFREDISTVIIQMKNNRPLHLEGAGHKHELVTGFNLSTLKQTFFLGEHRLIGAYTLTESYQPEELLFSFQKKQSWLKFDDDYLPIFRKIYQFRDKDWEYMLLESRGGFSASEFIAVEKEAPYRILVEKKRGREIPKIFSDKDKLPRTPEEVSWLWKLFLSDPGYLKEV